MNKDKKPKYKREIHRFFPYARLDLNCCPYLCTKEEAATYLGVSSRTIKRYWKEELIHKYQYRHMSMCDIVELHCLKIFKGDELGDEDAIIMAHGFFITFYNHFQKYANKFAWYKTARSISTAKYLYPDMEKDEKTDLFYLKYPAIECQ